MLPFKKGAFHVAVNSNLPILPIGTNPSKFSLAVTWPCNYSDCAASLSWFHRKGKTRTKLRWLGKSCLPKVFDSGTGYMTVLPLIWPQGRSVEELREVYWDYLMDCADSFFLRWRETRWLIKFGSRCSRHLIVFQPVCRQPVEVCQSCPRMAPLSVAP